MITFLITGTPPSALEHADCLAAASALPRTAVREAKRRNAVGKRLGQRNALKCHRFSLHTVTLLI